MGRTAANKAGAPPKVQAAANSKGASAPPSPAPPELPPGVTPVAAAMAAAAHHHDPAKVADPEAELAHLQQKRSDVAEQLRDVERQVHDAASWGLCA